MIDLLLLVVGLVLLTYAADRFVLGAARLASALRVAPVLIGAVVIGFGTSSPELLVSSLASLQDSPDIALGNIVGSNTVNILLVLGSAAVLRPMSVQSSTIRREVPLMLATSGLLALLTFDLSVRPFDGIALLLAAVLSIGAIIRMGLRDREAAAALEAEVAEFEGDAPPAVGPATLLTVLGLAGTLLGAQLLLRGATGVARALGVSEAVIGLTVVAVGTSLPELVTAIAAARRDEPDLVIGNVVGSNIFNAVVVGGVSLSLASAEVDPTFRMSLVVMLVTSVVGAVFLRSGHRVARWEGAVLLAGFVVSTALLF
ncbi:MAG TPA: calcium/sodium antiporter [Egibacteraceae bacterium]